MSSVRANRGTLRGTRATKDGSVIIYPETDGVPLDSQLNGAEMVRITETLDDYFADRPDVYVWMNMFVYYKEGDPSASVGPDVFVVRGVPKEPIRSVYKVWEEGRPPTVVFELTSDSTRHVDTGTKRERYAQIGVAEYFLYDAMGEYLRPRLQGNRLAGDHYAPIPAEPDGTLTSRELGLHLRLVDDRLQFFDPCTGERLLSRQERLDAANRRIAELEALLRQRNGQ